MKVAVTGKGGVGKTTLSSVLSYLYASEGKRVIAVDADPDANLAQGLGVTPEEIAKIRPIAEMGDLIEERTGAKPGTVGGMFKINPKVDDIPEGFGYRVDGITLMVWGRGPLFEWSSDSTRAAYMGLNTPIYLITRDGQMWKEVRGLIPSDPAFKVTPCDFRWSPDSHYLAVTMTKYDEGANTAISMLFVYDAQKD